MIPANFEYHRAASIAEAVQLLQQYGDDAKILAGGHSLLPAMKLRLNDPAHIIDISRLADLKYIKEDEGSIVIGAGTTHHEIAVSEMIQNKIPMLSQAANLIGDVQVRNRGTLAGSLAHADPAADWPAAMLAAESEIVVQGPGGSRSIAASDFFKGLFMTALQETEIITEIKVPIPSSDTKSTYVKFMQPASRFAIVGCAAMVTKSNGVCDDVKVAFTGVSTSAFRDVGVENALKGNTPDEGNVTVAADKAADGAEVMSDHFASEPYRRHLAKVYAKRALTALID